MAYRWSRHRKVSNPRVCLCLGSNDRWRRNTLYDSKVSTGIVSYLNHQPQVQVQVRVQVQAGTREVLVPACHFPDRQEPFEVED